MEAASPRLPTAIHTADQVRGLDRIAIEEFGIPSYALMCRAAEAAVAALRQHWPAAKSLAVYCGAGNNAGDGYVVARLAGDVGLQARVIAVVPPERLSGDAARAWNDYRDQGGSVEPFDANRLPDEDVLVDALLGNGLDRELRGDFLAAVSTMDAASRPVLSLDIPTGLHTDTGLPMGAAVHADLTVTFVGLKLGLFVGEGANYRGALEFAGLGIPSGRPCQGRASNGKADRCFSEGNSAASTPDRAQGGRGESAAGGWRPGYVRRDSSGRGGSAAVGSRIGARGNASRFSVSAVMAGRAEVMCVAVEEAPQLAPWLRAADGVVLGPGLGQSAWARAVWQQVLASELALVLDADGLNLLAEAGRARGKWILTPHPGEAARLLGTSTRKIQADRPSAAVQIAETYQCMAILKGAGTIIAAPGEAPIRLCDRGNPGMATAGMGDVLAGILGGLLVQSGDLSAVAQAGVWIHAVCGDAAAQGGERGLLAGDLMAHIRDAVNPLG